MAINIIEMSDNGFILINGYIRCIINLSNIPNVIIDIINKYFDGVEYAHLITRVHKEFKIHKHWKIRLSELIEQSTKI